jgi:hypothetical protein
VALTRQRETALIILAAKILERVPADRAIHDAGGTTSSQLFQHMSPDETTFVETLLRDTIVVTARDPDGTLRVAPRGPD